MDYLSRHPRCRLSFFVAKEALDSVQFACNLTSKNINMSLLATTRMSSRGQVVIPEEIRDRLHLSAGSQFVVLGEGDAIIFKILTAPCLKDFDGLIQKVRKQAKAAGIKPSDISKAITSVRKGK